MSPIRKITFADTHTVLYVDSAELRGKYLTTVTGITQPAVTTFWRRAVRQWKPTIALDVGMNYGEVIFSTLYEGHTRIVGIEANRLLSPCIRQSLADHPNQRQMTIVYALASDRQQQNATFYVDRNWSGTSTALPLYNHKHMEEQVIEAITVDSLFSIQPLVGERLLFKIDVEGYERHVLRGMSRLLASCSGVLGLIECNTTFLQAAGVNPVHFFDELLQDFTVYVLASTDRLLFFSPLSVDGLRRFYDKDAVECNLLLASKKEKVLPAGYDVQQVSLCQ
ncbi:MAG: FkbM family methyltransferase [Brevibacillus sp.]|nr:FkbM family methyltransferase [Brevibacillus sp.]